ncbi:hypothetical protein NSK11_contig00012-0020 [Nocardia seriolae]|uniref:Uncharacterized protein n=1 Tax=Nocardia seriolae TaxID=37332 RepID=A0ABC9YP15_9NOCA|nr:hypothetical protein NSERKGN1266_58790 [Nocardia seriolae]BEK94237.1 hypothetical protein NSER024013_21430 [Nocardia seriolae]GAM44965.1 hypothetical protein NS07_v2contig00010-0020 [Nocardia seriolae]GAP26985.1 hypothetical protein NSK11_contig00012-0020 [Nocardia seriolae]GEM26824.1 hypothetical protein NS2_50630 [Nocardia seriolae NBRC 15557]
MGGRSRVAGTGGVAVVPRVRRRPDGEAATPLGVTRPGPVTTPDPVTTPSVSRAGSGIAISSGGSPWRS